MLPFDFIFQLIYYIVVFYDFLKMVKGKSNTNNAILSEEQFKDIKETILENVSKVLLEILNDIFPVIMDKVSDIIKTNIKEYIPTSCLTNSRESNAKELEEFMSANNATWSNFIKKRNR